MRRRTIAPLLAAPLLALMPGLASAQTPDAGSLAQAVRSADWLSAQSLAAGYPDPIAAKLVTYYRLLHAGDGTAAEIAAFMAANPDWPNQALLLKRRDEALGREADDATVLRLCQPAPLVPAPTSGTGLARCADAQHAAGLPVAIQTAQAAWIAGLPEDGTAARFLAQWAAAIGPATQMARFRALLAAGSPAAAGLVGRLSAADQAIARARLAVRAASPAAEALVAALPAADRRDPGLMLDRLRALRRADHDDDAVALWDAGGYAAEAADPAAGAAFWAERSQLARKRLRAGDNAGAFRLADDASLTDAEPQADAAFLAGFIALRRLNRPSEAAARFRRLVGSTAVLSQSRAHYWLARAAAAAGDQAGAARDYAAAAAWPTTFYGQLAALALGDDPARLQDRITALADPGWTSQQALDFAGRELPRAAAMLVAWGDPPRARAFLQQVAALAPDPATRSLGAHLALGLDLPDQAVAAARRAGRAGTVLPQAGWPLADDPGSQDVPAAVALGIMRQESSFDPGAISPSGAHGLMQLMPATAAAVGRQTGTPAAIADLADPAINMRLGTAYLHQLIDRFGGSLPLAIAAYNAGPNRVQQWLDETGDPARPGVGMIDWIELIPFSETRNYVQRVVENITVYRARLRQPLPYPAAPS